MNTIPEIEALAKLPMAEWRGVLAEFLGPVEAHLPEKRLRVIASLAIQGILSGQSPLITRMAAGVVRQGETSWPMARRLYRFVWNDRFTHRHLLKGLYGIAQREVEQEQPAYLVVAVDPVNFEKPYTRALEGVSTVMKATPPDRSGEKRLTSGYPAITATLVNLRVPVVSYANWFSYQTADFVSEHREVYRALRTTRALFPRQRLCFVADSGLDDQEIFAQTRLVHAKFIFRSCHNRMVQVYDPQRQHWDAKLLYDLTEAAPTLGSLRVAFRHARQRRIVDVSLSWFPVRVPETGQHLWVLVAYDPDYDRYLVLLTNIRLTNVSAAMAVYTAWRFRSRIEHTYRFDQEDGLQIEDIQVQTLERMRRVFVLVLLSALLIYHLNRVWQPQIILWLRELGGKLGLKSDRDGFYILLAGLRMLLVTFATLTFAAFHTFLNPGLTCG